MTDEPDTGTHEELEKEEGQPLPDREVMSIITPEPQPFPDDGAEPDYPEPLRGGEGS